MNLPIRIAATLLAFTALTATAWADAETDALKSQIKQLEARLDALERKQAQANAATDNAATGQHTPAAALPAATAAPAASPDLNQRVTALEATTPTARYTPGKGLALTSPDHAVTLHIGGYFQADSRGFLNGSAASPSQFLIRSARPSIDATIYDRFSARLMTDFGNNQTTLLDAYGDYHADPAFSLRLGKFKDPIGLERWQSEQNVLFVERGMTTNLVPYRDIGAQAYGEFLPGALEYQLAVTNGAPDLVNSTGSTDSDKTVTARLLAHPFADGPAPLKGLGAGFAISSGGRGGSVANPNLTTGYVTPAQSKFFAYASTTYADDNDTRYNPQLMYYNGPLSLLGEYVREDLEVRSGTRAANLANDAWMATGTFVLTGEDARFDGVVPRANFNPAHGDWGAFELVTRMSRLRVDDDTFPTFASLATSARIATENSVGGTWYLNPMIKLNLDFALTRFTGGAGGGDRPTERAILSRAQFSF